MAPPSTGAILDLLVCGGYLAVVMPQTALLAHSEVRLTKNVRDTVVRSGTRAPSTLLREYYRAMYDALGPQHWWPGRTQFEIIVGAILTQNTAWVNVERAIGNLRREGLLRPRAIAEVASGKLARLLRPSGYFRQKAKKLKAFVSFLRSEYGGSLPKMFRTRTLELREKLLGVHGIGPETADSILLYAGGHPVFVVDAYTRRILERHELTPGSRGYEEIQNYFETQLPRDAVLFNEYHALLVNVGKNWCRKEAPCCRECPLGPYLPAEKKSTWVEGAPARAVGAPGL